MEIIRGLHNIRARHKGCVATIGNFDGVHKGHQAILSRLCQKAQVYHLPALVICFDPQPQEFFSGQSFARLSRLRDKAEIFRALGVQRILVIYFNQAFAAISANDFVDQILVQQLGIRYLLVGDDFRYGKGRAGNYRQLAEKATYHHFELDSIDTISEDNQRISSSRIRQLLETGDVTAASRLLGRPYYISGHVQHGAKKGRTIGFPTANIPLHRNTPAVRGVYIVQLWKKDKDQVYNGVANIGFRPTVDGTRALLEVHLFDFQDNLYGQLVHVHFIRRIRAEKKFDSFELLRRQIEQDVTLAKQYFQEQGHT